MSDTYTGPDGKTCDTCMHTWDSDGNLCDLFCIEVTEHRPACQNYDDGGE